MQRLIRNAETHPPIVSKRGSFGVTDNYLLNYYITLDFYVIHVKRIDFILPIM